MKLLWNPDAFGVPKALPRLRLEAVCKRFQDLVHNAGCLDWEFNRAEDELAFLRYMLQQRRCATLLTRVALSVERPVNVAAILHKSDPVSLPEHGCNRPAADVIPLFNNVSNRRFARASSPGKLLKRVHHDNRSGQTGLTSRVRRHGDVSNQSAVTSATTAPLAPRLEGRGVRDESQTVSLQQMSEETASMRAPR